MKNCYATPTFSKNQKLHGVRHWISVNFGETANMMVVHLLVIPWNITQGLIVEVVDSS